MYFHVQRSKMVMHINLPKILLPKLIDSAGEIGGV